MSNHHFGRILIVDDDAKLRFVLKAGLGTTGFEVFEAVDGLDGLQKAQKIQPDIIVMDISMPRMDGLETTRALQENPQTRDIPILILTARSNTEDVVVALEAGAQDYLRKPFDITELQARIRTLHRLIRAKRDLNDLNDRLENEINAKTKRLQVLYEGMRDLNETHSQDKVLDVLINCVRSLTDAGRISIMLTDTDGKNLVCKRALGIDPEVVNSIKISAQEGISGQVYQSGKTLSARTIGEIEKSHRGYDSQAFLSTPLISNSLDMTTNILGVINITDKAIDDFSRDEIDCIRSIADAAAITLENIRQRGELRDSVQILLQTVGHLAEYRDEETTLHLARVSKMSGILARQMVKSSPPGGEELTDEWIQMLMQAAPLHDIGKVGIPDEILTKPGKLTNEEFDIMKTHTEIGRKVLSMPLNPSRKLPLLEMCVDIAYCHHERYDGRGYPRGIEGVNIPLAARIITLVDAYDAITSRRRYKKERSHEEAAQIIKSEAGKHFDPQLVAAFLACQNEFDAIRARYEDTLEVAVV